MFWKSITIKLLLLFYLIPLNENVTGQDQNEETVIINHFITLLTNDTQGRKQAIDYLKATWREEYIIPIIDVIYLTSDSWSYQYLFDLLYEKTRLTMGRDVNEWLDWIWNNEQKILPFHDNLMASIYRNIDLKFELYFKNRRNQSSIRFDEIRWGGVGQDGIPPLRDPKMIDASEAKYLDDDNIVFGIEINGDTRAYPKRILAWHEMFVDNVDGKNIAGVYCTLCGTVIIYDTEFDGVHHELGTSGFLYRSNKLMYDKATQSLWNTIEGAPVVGPLTGKGIELITYSVVTTTWKEWKNIHPTTKVLSIETGHARNYAEGVAYARYFATDELMFTVPKNDKRLKNKEEVFVVRPTGYRKDPLAISTHFLKKNKIYYDQISGKSFVVITDQSGASRAYHDGGTKFKKIISGDRIVDDDGNTWRIGEGSLKSDHGTELNRLPSHRIFWFAWYNAYPDTRLVK